MILFLKYFIHLVIRLLINKGPSPFSLSSVLFLSVYISTSLFGQNNNIGTPFTINYSNKIYQAGTQNWDISQHPNGFIFFANNNGLLQFDGTNWQVFPLPNKTIARAIHIATDGKIYVGGQGEFGYFKPDPFGQLKYQSLVEVIPLQEKAFEDVWEIVEFQGSIFFNASKKIYEYNREGIKIHSKGKIEFLGKSNQKLYVGNEAGLSELVNGQFNLIKGSQLLNNGIITNILPGEKEELIIVTLKNGLFELRNNIIRPKVHTGADFLKKNTIYCATEITKDLVALGIIGKGLIIMNKKGKFLYYLNNRNGLQNNNTLSVFSGTDGNLWLGLDNGIDYVHVNTSFSKLVPDKELAGTAYTAKIVDNALFLGTSSGLYRQNWQTYYNPRQQNDFELINGSKGQIWNLTNVSKDLFLGHHEGSFIVNKNSLEKINKNGGNWIYQVLEKHPNYLVSGTYQGLELYQKKEGGWQFIKKFEGFDESARIMEQDQKGNIWIAHPYRGIYKIQLTADFSGITVKEYGQKEGLPSNNNNHVFKINGEIVFTGQTGIFTYNPSKDSFIPNQDFEKIIGKDQQVLRLFEDPKNNIWYTTTKETGILRIKDKGVSKTFSKQVYPELNNKLVRGFEFIYPYDDHSVFIGAEKGFIHFDPSKRKTANKLPFHTNIVHVESIDYQDSILFFGQYESIVSEHPVSFTHKVNAFRFSYSATNFMAIDDIVYSTNLVGLDKGWSNWSKKTNKEYTNLNPGKYSFLVKAKNAFNKESEIASYRFTIQPPWYASGKAIAIYILLGLLSLASLIFIPQLKFKKEKAKLQSLAAEQNKEHQEELEQGEQQIIALKNKHLQTEIAHKNSELALITMHYVQRNELLVKLQEPLNKILRKTTDKVAISEIKRINRLIKEKVNLEEVWHQFAQQFDQVHIDFLKRLREKHPQLTPNDHKLCAYLKMNLSTKEIAGLLNISIRGVEVARYRLRKKLKLESNVNLNEFMLSI